MTDRGIRMTGKDMFNRKSGLKNGFVPRQSAFLVSLVNDIRNKDAVIAGLTKMVDKLSRKILIMKRHNQRLKSQR